MTLIIPGIITFTVSGQAFWLFVVPLAVLLVLLAGVGALALFKTEHEDRGL